MSERIKPTSVGKGAVSSRQLRKANPSRYKQRLQPQRDFRLLAGARGWLKNLRDCWRIAYEFYYGFSRLRGIDPCVTIFGSARFDEHHRYYQLARSMAASLGSHGFAIMTGGGPGIMEAANRGARDVGALSVGCNIVLPHEQRPNPYLDIWTEFNHFFIRKVMLVKYSKAFVVLPGGFGTMDEVFETLTLIQNAKIQRFPLVLMGTDYWRHLETLIEDTMLAEKTISADDLNLLLVTDDPQEALFFIQQYCSEAECGLSKR